MGYFPFVNYYFKMGVTVMGFAEHFGLGFTRKIHPDIKTNFCTDNTVCVKILQERGEEEMPKS